MYPSPLKGVPAGTLLAGRADRLFAALGVVLGDEGIPGVFAGDGVKGVENGWAAEVEVAGGGLSGWRSLEVVVRVRRPVEWGNGCDRRRIQRWQIIVYRLWVVNDDLKIWLLVCTLMPRRRTIKLTANCKIPEFYPLAKPR